MSDARLSHGIAYRSSLNGSKSLATALGHIVGLLEKNDLSLIMIFAIFSAIDVKMNSIPVDYDGNVVSKNHMHAVF